MMPEVFRSRARTFWFAARFLPADRRHAVAGLYAFARAVDDLVDEPPPALLPDDVLGQLAAWRGWLEQPASLAPPDEALAARVTPALLVHGVPPAYLQMLVDGVASDVTPTELRSWSELRAYCLLVAASVGLAMCHLLGAGDDPLAREAAVELGIGMQLTNILRDLGADLRSGRVYLPTDDLAMHGYSPDRLDWLAGRVARSGAAALDDDSRDLMRTQIGRARDHYVRGMRGVARLPVDCRLAIMLAARLYQAILDDIEVADYDVFTRRAATSTRFKVAESVRCAFALRQLPRSRMGSSTRRSPQRVAPPAAATSDLMPLVGS